MASAKSSPPKVSPPALVHRLAPLSFTALTNKQPKNSVCVRVRACVCVCCRCLALSLGGTKGHKPKTDFPRERSVRFPTKRQAVNSLQEGKPFKEGGKFYAEGYRQYVGISPLSPLSLFRRVTFGDQEKRERSGQMMEKYQEEKRPH